MTVIFSLSKATEISALSIYNNIIAQLGLLQYLGPIPDTWPAAKPKDIAPIPLTFRLLSVRVWGLGRQPIQLAIFETQNTDHLIKELNDYGDPIRFSRVGWKFGDVAVYDGLSKETYGLFQVSGTLNDANKALVYCQVLLRVQNAPAPALTGLPDSLDAMAF